MIDFIGPLVIEFFRCKCPHGRDIPSYSKGESPLIWNANEYIPFRRQNSCHFLQGEIQVDHVLEVVHVNDTIDALVS